jgi:hypothetical protein
MPVVDLSDQEWNQVMGILGEAPWRVSNPLLMRIGGQLQRQQQQHVNKQTNSEEMPINIGENAVKQ